MYYNWLNEKVTKLMQPCLSLILDLRAPDSTLDAVLKYIKH